MMRKTICILVSVLMGVLSASAQHYVGVKAGYGAAHGRFFPVPDKSGMAWNKYTGGLVWKYFSQQQVVGGVSAELEFQQRGYTIYEGDGAVLGEGYYEGRTRTVNSVTMPLIWQPHLYMIDRRVRFFLSAGVTLTYNTGLGDKLTNTVYTWDNETMTHTPTATTVPYEMQTARDVSWNYGWLGGAGLSVLAGRWEIFAEGRYYYGMADILRTKTKYRFNEEDSIRSELDNIYITIGVTMRLGRGGILASPLSKRKRAGVADDNFTNIKQGRR